MHLCAWTIISAFNIFISKVNGEARFLLDPVENLKTELRGALDRLKNMPMETLTFKKFFLWIEEAKRPANEAMRKHMCNIPGSGEWHGCDLAKKWLAEMKIAKDSGLKKLEERKAKFAEKDAYLRNLVDTWTAPLPACPPWWPFPSPWCQQEIDPLMMGKSKVNGNSRFFSDHSIENSRMMRHMCHSRSRFFPGNGGWHGCDPYRQWCAEMREWCNSLSWPFPSITCHQQIC